MKNEIFYLITIILIFFISCNPTEPPDPPQPDNRKITLTFENASCTEVWLNINAENTSLPFDVTVRLDNNAAEVFNLSSSDTTIYLDSLLPNKSYSIQAFLQSSNQSEISSNVIAATTMDTTSHNFTWQTFTFGNPEEAGSSVLYDVAIIDENNIWAVGEIFVNDSMGQPDPQPYNLAVWDGQNWKLKKLYYNLIPPVIRSIFVINEHDVWLDPWFYWDGQNFQEIPIDPILNGVRVNNIWSNSDGIFVVGNSGFIAFRNTNGVWQKIESGTDSDIRDIWGTIEPGTGTLKILATAASINNSKILTLTFSSANDTLNWQANESLSGIWLDGRRTYVSGIDIWINKNDNWQKATSTGNFFTSVRGNKFNNIYGIGPDGIVHFNGSTWATIKEDPVDITLTAGDCSNNMVIAVGFTSSGSVVGKAAIMMGTQN